MTGAAKTIHRGKIVTTFIMGSQRSVRLGARQSDGRNAAGRLHQRHVDDSAEHAHDGDQSALQVDLTGQVCADSIGTRILQRRWRADGFHAWRGALNGRKAIIALPSTARAARSRGSCPYLPKARA